MEAKELIYFAGLFDGEGCIHIRKTKTKTQKVTYALVCKVTMCNFPALKQLHNSFGGSLIKEKEHKYSNRHNKLWSWTISCVMAKSFLLQICPFLRIKKDEANLALLFQQGKRSGAVDKWGNESKTEETLAVEESQYLEMRKLKQGVGI